MNDAITFEESYQFYGRNLHDRKTKVLLYGHLRKKFGKLHEISVKTPREAVQALCRKFPGFFKAIRFYKPGFAVFIGDDNIDEMCLDLQCGDQDIRIIPIIAGSGNQNWLQVIVGVVLVIIGCVINYYSVGTGGNSFIAAGAAMIVGGVVNMLFAPKNPDVPQESDGHKPSFLFNGPVNTYAQGHCVPVLLGGPLRVGSAVISASLISEEWNQGGITNNPTDVTNIGSGGGGVDNGSDGRTWHISSTYA